MALISLMALGIFCLFCLPGYLLTGFGLDAIARRRRIDHRWTAWVPLVNLWLLGCISDQYQSILKGKDPNKRTILPWLLAIQILVYLGSVYLSFDTSGGNALFMLILIPVWASSAVLAVLAAMALHDLYASCDPKRKWLYLLLSLLFPVTQPVFLFLCRKQDLGMPPGF